MAKARAIFHLRNRTDPNRSSARARWFTYFLILTWTAIFPLMVAEGSEPGWEQVGEGIEYRQFKLPDPNNVFVARLDRSNTNATIESSIARGRLSGGFETVSGMSERYDQAINFWGQSWGARNQVVVAINGHFYNTSTGIPRSGQVHSGWYAKRFDDLSGESGFAWKLDRSAFIGFCVHHQPAKQTIQHVASGASIQFDGINAVRKANQVILYTPQYDRDTQTDDAGVEILVEMTRPSLILPSPSYARGYVRAIRSSQGSTELPFDHLVFSAHGTAVTEFASFKVGDEVRISQEFTHFSADCTPPYQRDWTKTYASIGGSFRFLEDGNIVSYDDPGATDRHPRTAIAFNDSYIYFIVVDGRNPGVSIGMSIDELASFAKNSLGATWGIAQDGGGSSTMVVNGEVVNHPNAEFYAHRLYLPSVSISPSETEDVQSETRLFETPFNPAEPLEVERYVANGMMMVVVEPMEQSTTYSAGNFLQTTNEVDLRLGPGSNYASRLTIPAASLVEVVPHINNLNGVLAKGSFWWKVRYNGLEGWIAEELLQPMDGP
jgi:hypothetical protein